MNRNYVRIVFCLSLNLIIDLELLLRNYGNKNPIRTSLDFENSSYEPKFNSLFIVRIDNYDKPVATKYPVRMLPSITLWAFHTHVRQCLPTYEKWIRILFKWEDISQCLS